MFYSAAAMGVSGRLVGTEIHGFYTLQDLDVVTTLEEARARWLRPNEIHAMLCNYKYFIINVKPINLPKSGTIIMFDRKMLRNFRKDGHNWKKKKDGKTVKEAHEHLKVGNEERIHVYYAHGQDNPTFVRRCYWLLDKALEHIVLVHYRETQEMVDSPRTPMKSISNSNSSSISEHSNAWPLSEETESSTGNAPFSDVKEPVSVESLKIMNHQMRLHEINTLEWDELVANDLNTSELKGAILTLSNQPNQGYPPGEDLGLNTRLLLNSSYEDINKKTYNSQPVDPLDFFGNDGLQRQDSFGKWINFAVSDSSPVSDSVVIDTPSGQGDFALLEGNEFVASEPVFAITDVSPSWGFATETTKILITGYFPEEYQHVSQTYMYCICGDEPFPLEFVQPGVYRGFVSSDSSGQVDLCMSFDRRRPVSKVVPFEFRKMSTPARADDDDDGDDAQWENFLIQMRLLKLLLPISKNLSAFAGEAPEHLRAAKKFTNKVSPYAHSWAQALADSFTSKVPADHARSQLLDFILKNLIKDWLLERVLEGSKATEFDQYGQGVIHLCAILGYTWVVQLFKISKLSLDFRDKRGWTALHWASYCGKQKMVGTLLSFGAKANRVTDPTPENPGGCTASDLASSKGFEGLAAYLSEKALVTHFGEMTIAGNATGALQPRDEETDNLNEEDVGLKDSLAAYRTAADAAARIQSAFREQSLKARTKAVEFENPQEEARGIVAAMKIQNAYRNFEGRKKIAAAARIQYRFRTWKMRREFLNLRTHAIKIQAAFRAFQARINYKKIVWSVGVLEKAILRWRLKRKGFRGLQVDESEKIAEQKGESDAEEDFYKHSRKLAEERVERSVVRVQAMFRSKKAQAEYQRMKQAHNEARLEYNTFEDSDEETDMITS